MKRLFPHFLAIATMFALATGCAKSDADDPDSPNSNISVPDPEGTVTVSLRNANSGKTYLDDYSIYIDKADNFTGGRFVSLGKVKGLGNVTRIPVGGWSSTIAVVPGEGYVAYSGSNFFRIYVVKYTTNVANEIIGAEIKFQRPFAGAGKLSLPKTSVVFDSTGGEETLKFGDDIVPFSFTLDGGTSSSITQPAGCEVEITHVERYSFLPNGITIRASENPSMNDVKHTVALKTVNGKEYEIDVTIKAAKPYISFDTEKIEDIGYGTTKTVKILTNTDYAKLRIAGETEWCKASISDKNLVITTVAGNYSASDRTAKITLSSNDNSGKASISITQLKTYITPVDDKTTVSLSANGKTDTFAISTNITPEDLQIKSTQSWITATQQIANNGKITYAVACDENATGKDRKGIVTVYTDKCKGVLSEISVEQAKHTFALSAEQVYFDRQQLNSQVTLTTTASVFSAKSNDESWCTTSWNKNVMTVRSTANDTSKNRTAHITVTLNDGQAKTITVHQGIYTVGDTYDVNGVTGIVFDTYYDNDFHGKIMSAEKGYLPWSNEFVQTGAIDENDGMKNMKIIKAIPNWKTLYPAFAWCAEYGDGWYLPSINELKALFDATSWHFPDNPFWSSTEAYDRRAREFYFSDGHSFLTDKGHNHLILAIFVF